MTIIVTTPGGQTVKLQPTHVQREDVLQKYIHEHPECLPLDEIREDVRLLVVCREFPTASGPIDALGVDQEGEIYIIETKLFKNPDKRTVLAQALDYGSALWHADNAGGSFVDRVEAVLSGRGLPPLREQLSETFGDSSAVESVIDGIQKNQAAGAFRFVILMDRLEDRLRDLVTFINENSKFTVYAVELDFYRHDGLEIVLPKLHGAEVKKSISATGPGSSRRRWDSASFFADAEAKLSERELNAVRAVYDSAGQWADEISWGTGTTAGSFSPKKRPEWPQAPFAVYSDGRLLLNFPYFASGTSGEHVHRFAEVLLQAG